MDDFLDAMYGTRDNISGPDLSTMEKNAEAELLIDALKQEGYNTDQIDAMSGDDVLKVATVLFGDDSVLVKAASSHTDTGHKDGETDEEYKARKAKYEKEMKDKEAAGDSETYEEKVAHADQLGRIMAHSFVDEISNIEKQAQYDQIKEAKAQQAGAVIDQLSQTPAEKIAAKLAGHQPAPAVDEEKVAYALALLKEAGVPLA